MLFLTVRLNTSSSSHHLTRILMAGSAPSNHRRYKNNRTFHQTTRAPPSLLDQPQYPAHLYQWKLTHEPHEPHLHWNPRFRNQQHQQSEEPTPNWDQWFQQHQQPPSLLPYSQRNDSHSQDQLYYLDQSRSSSTLPYPKRTKQYQSPSTINEPNTRETPYHHYDHHLPKRHWSYTGFSRQMNTRHHHFLFDVVCYNILAQTLVETNPYLYVNCQPEHLDWNRRKKLLLKELIRQNADIICLQEMQDDHYEQDFRPKLMEHGYESIYLKRSGDKSDGCCLFYKFDRLQLVNSKTVPFYQENIPLLDRDNCGLIALFQPRSSNATANDLFCVATTHLLFSPKRGDIKLAQMQYFLAEIDRLAMKDANANSYYPIIVCGDLNAQPQSPLYEFLIGGHIKYDVYRRMDISGQIPASMAGGRFSLPLPSNELLPTSFVTADCRFPVSTQTETVTTTEASKDAIIFQTYLDQQTSATLTHNKRFYSVYESDSSMSDVTSRVAHESNFVDFIFYTQQNDDRQRMNLVARYDLYKQNQMNNVHLPNAQFGSDHFLLAAKFALKLRKRTK